MKKSKWSNYNTKEDFQKFIDDNEIQKASEFQKKFLGLYNRARRFNLHFELKYPAGEQDWSNYNTVKDFQKFIDDNEIQNSVDFLHRFGGLFCKGHDLKLLCELNYSEGNHDWNNYNTVKDFQKFIDDNEIQKVSEFQHRFSGLFKKARCLKLLSELNYPKTHKSQGEIITERILEELSLLYEYNRTFNGLKIRPDYIIEKYKLIIEYQGAQHFITSKYFKKSGEEQRRADEKKYKIMTEAGYKVIYVSFPKLDPAMNKVDLTQPYIDELYTDEESLKARIKEYIENYKK